MTEQVFTRSNSLAQEISRDPLSADLLFTLFAAQIGTSFEDKGAPQPNGKTLDQIIQAMPPMQQLASYSNDDELIQAIGSDAAEVLRFAILNSPSAYFCLPESQEIAALRRQSPTENQPKCYQFKVLQPPAGKEEIFQAIKAKYNDTLYLWHGSSAERWYHINKSGLINPENNSRLMTSGAAYGAGIYLTPSSETSAAYSTKSQNKYPNSQLGKEISITSLFEVINLPNGKDCTVDVQVNNQQKKLNGQLTFHDWTYKLTLNEACIIRYLFVNLDASVDLNKDKSLISSLK